MSIKDQHSSLTLSKQLMLLEDPDHRMDLEDAKAALQAGRFKAVDEDHLQLGYNDSTYWLYFKLRNDLLSHTADNREDRFYLTVDYPLLDNVEFFHQRQNQLFTMVTGDIYLFSQRYFNLNNYVFPLALTPGETGEIYIRVFSNSSLFIPVTLQTEQSFIDQRFTLDTLDGIYIGITVGLGIYNLFLWLGIRSRVYGLYVLMVFNIMLFNTSINGLTFRLWPESLTFQQIPVYLFSYTSGIAVILFGMAYLKTHSSHPYFHRLFQVLVLLCLALIPTLFFLPIPLSAKLTAGITVVCALSLIGAAIRSLMAGYRPAVYYCLGQGAVIISVLFTALTSQKIIPLYHIAPVVMKWCSAFELILFSIGLADMVHNERRLREKAQKETALAQQELLDSQIKLNQDLDDLVTQRTRELEQANQLLRDLNTKDDLTGLRNRRFLNEALPNEYRRAYRDKAPLSILLLDIDYFKQLNDTYGHQFGDHCLCAAGRLLEDCTRRPPDIAVRYGGEEFVIVLPNTDLDGALTVAEKIRSAFEKQVIRHAGQSARVTVSIGLASETPLQRDEHEALLRMADDLLYQAKANGRNRVEAVGQSSPPKENSL
ncbi:diguanylate cyclase [Ketobacter sp.]|uniref:sensor domain-containing diguanylate cyclase n=1 Tax=Ketobacter sp. TaxID=2083498 RepID=UPI0025C58147|nr:diguanylate cyclase [Ketobacter sp.]